MSRSHSHQPPVKPGFRTIVYATNLAAQEDAFAKVVINTREMNDGIIHLVRINTPMDSKSDVQVMKDMEAFATRMKLKNYTINTFND